MEAIGMNHEQHYCNSCIYFGGSVIEYFPFDLPNAGPTSTHTRRVGRLVFFYKLAFLFFINLIFIYLGLIINACFSDFFFLENIS